MADKSPGTEPHSGGNDGAPPTSVTYVTNHYENIPPLVKWPAAVFFTLGIPALFVGLTFLWIIKDDLSHIKKDIPAIRETIDQLLVGQGWIDTNEPQVRIYTFPLHTTVVIPEGLERTEGPVWVKALPERSTRPADLDSRYGYLDWALTLDLGDVAFTGLPFFRVEKPRGEGATILRKGFEITSTWDEVPDIKVIPSCRGAAGCLRVDTNESGLYILVREVSE